MLFYLRVYKIKPVVVLVQSISLVAVAVQTSRLTRYEMVPIPLYEALHPALR
jgi:hypothetical protein